MGSLLHNLADLHRELGEYDQGLRRAERALRVRERALGSDHPDVAQSLDCLGGLLQEVGRYDEAEPLLVQAYESLVQMPYVEMRAESVREQVVLLYEAWGKPERAREYGG